MDIPLIGNEEISYPFLNITTNKIEYLTDAQAAGRDDIRRIRPGEKITPEQMPGTSVPAPASS